MTSFEFGNPIVKNRGLMCNLNMAEQLLWREVSDVEIQSRLDEQKLKSIRLVYSSYWGGFTKDPRWALIPFHDHLVHRGDGVFEALKVINSKLFLLDAHLERLQRSMELIGLKLPCSFEELKALCLKAVEESGMNEAYLRIFVTRGGGTFGVSPYESQKNHLYLMVLDYAPLPAQKYELGVKVCQAKVPPKWGWMSQVKSCNYLPNVMMKKEAIDRGFEFAVGVDPNGFLTESSTENFVIFDEKTGFKIPKLDHTLKGTTVMYFLNLAKQKLRIPFEHTDINLEMIKKCDAAFLVGTTLGVLPVTTFENIQISLGRAHARTREFNQLIEAEYK